MPTLSRTMSRARGGLTCDSPFRVAPRHAGAKLGELLDALRRAGVVGVHAAVLGSEAVGDGHVERLERPHLAVKPGVGVGAEGVGPAQARAEVGDAEVFEQTDAVV